MRYLVVAASLAQPTAAIYPCFYCKERRIPGHRVTQYSIYTLGRVGVPNPFTMSWGLGSSCGTLWYICLTGRSYK